MGHVSIEKEIQFRTQPEAHQLIRVQLNPGKRYRNDGRNETKSRETFCRRHFHTPRGTRRFRGINHAVRKNFSSVSFSTDWNRFDRGRERVLLSNKEVFVLVCRERERLEEEFDDFSRSSREEYIKIYIFT